MAYADLKNKLDEYNWDDGFEVPRTILADPDCDLALALEIFYLAGGYEYLEKSAKRTKLQKWNPFITVLYEDILDNRFPKTVFVNKKVLQKGSKKVSTFNTQ